jgi:hypothetical protein
MKLSVRVVIEHADGSTVVTEVTTVEREELSDETLGLTLAESKMLLAGVQEVMTAQQVASYSAAQAACPGTGGRGRERGLWPSGGASSRRGRQPCRPCCWRRKHSNPAPKRTL